MRRISTLILVSLALAACGGGGSQNSGDADSAATHTDDMAREHAGDRPGTNASAMEPRQEVTGEDVVYGTVNGRQARGFLARPATVRPGKTLPGVIVIHEWWGLNDNIRMMTRRLAGEGYTALAVDMYGGRVATRPRDAERYMGEVLADTDAGMANLAAAATYLKQQAGAGKLGVIGWCFGGAWSLQAALGLPGQVDAAVMYYGRVVTDRARLAALDAPLLGLFGERDGAIPADQVREMEALLGELGKNAEIVVYPGARHAFANPSGDTYRAESAADAWSRTTAFFARHLGS